MQELLAMVDLEYLLGRYGPDEEVNWGEVSASSRRPLSLCGKHAACVRR